MVGARVGELIGEAQLVYNWQAEAGDVAPLVHAHPHPERGVRRGPPCPGGSQCMHTASTRLRSLRRRTAIR